MGTGIPVDLYIINVKLQFHTSVSACHCRPGEFQPLNETATEYLTQVNRTEAGLPRGFN